MGVTLSQQAGTEPVQGQPEAVVTPPVTDEGNQNNPPYWEDLQKLPESVRPLVEPVFKNWDTGVTQRIQQVHSEYEPWKQFTDNGFEPDQVSEALQLAQMLEADPKALWDLMAQHYNFAATEQGQQQNQSQQTETPAGEEEDPYGERFGKLETALEQIAQLVTGTYNEQQAKEQTQMLDNTLNELRDKYKDRGDFDEDFVLNRIVLGDEPEAAVQSYYAAIDNAITARGLSPNNNGAPVVANTGGGTPSVVDGGLKPGELSNKQTEDLVATMLRQAAEANR